MSFAYPTREDAIAALPTIWDIVTGKPPATAKAVLDGYTVGGYGLSVAFPATAPTPAPAIRMEMKLVEVHDKVREMLKPHFSGGADIKPDSINWIQLGLLVLKVVEGVVAALPAAA